MRTGTLSPRTTSCAAVVLFQPHRTKFLVRLRPSPTGPHVLPTGSLFMIASHTLSCISSSRCPSQCTSLPHPFQVPAFVLTNVGKPGCGNGSGAFDVPSGGKIGASRNRLDTLLG